MLNKTISRWLYFALIAFVCVVLQNFILPRFNGFHPLPVPVYIAMVSLFGGGFGGGLCGFLCGLVCDASTTPSGTFFALYFMIAGGIIGYLSPKYFQKSFIMSLLLSLATLALMDVLYYFFFFGITGKAPLSALYTTALPEVSLSLIFVPILYLFMKPFDAKLSARRRI